MQDILASPDMAYVIYTGLALGVFLLFSGITQLLSRAENRNEAQSRRMRMIAKGATTEELLALLKPGHTEGVLSRLPFIGDLPRMMQRGGMTISAARLLLLCAVGALVLLVAAAQVLPPLQALLIAVCVGLLLPVVIVRVQCKRRTEALVHQLPDALDLLARGLKVGHPLNTTISAVANEMADPIGTEFGIIFDQVSYGDELVDAFAEFAERVDLEDVHYLSASIGIQHGTGGDLARVIQLLSRTIRDRIAMRRRIQAISAEGRLSANFLSLLPLAIYGFTSMSSPDYYSGVSGDPLYMPMMIAIVGFTLVNYVVLKRLVNFHI